MAVAPRHVQDPFGLRAFAQVLGPALELVGDLERVLEIDLNAAAESPLVADDAILHNGNWHAMPIALRLDALRLALRAVAALSASRVSNLMDPDVTGTVSVSQGLESHASFAPLSVTMASRLLPASGTVLACELVAACRAVILSGRTTQDLRPARIGSYLADALAALPSELADRPLSADLEAAEALLARWGAAS